MEEIDVMEYGSYETDRDQVLSDDQQTFVSFHMYTQEFCFPIGLVKEIITPPRITRVIYTPELIQGVINLRGVVIMVINLKKILQFPGSYNNPNNKIIITSIDNKLAGFYVDQIEAVKTVNTDQIEPLMGGGFGNSMRYFKGLIHYDTKSATILDAQKILEHQEIRQFE